MQTFSEFDFFPLHFDKDGKPDAAADFDAIKRHAGGATDLILLAHGFRNSEADATGLYTEFLTTFRKNLSRPEFAAVAARKFAVGGVYWPSKQFREDFTPQANVQSDDGNLLEIAAVQAQLEDMKADLSAEQQDALAQAQALLPSLSASTDAQNQFVNLVLSIIEEPEPDPTEGLQQLRSQEGSAVLNKLRMPLAVPARAAAASEGGVMAVGMAEPISGDGGDGGTEGIGSFFGSIMQGVGEFLNGTTWWTMKNRCGVVGATGVASLVRQLKADHPGLKVHLVGHSLGGRLMAACAKSLAQDPLCQPDSLTLLEAAFSHYGFSPNNGDGVAGFFRDVISKRVVKGPLVETFSALDTVVGHIYALASRVADDNVKAIGDANDQFGGIGRNGTQKTDEKVFEDLHLAGTPYHFSTGIVTNLDGSANLIKDHGDVKNENVTYAFASVLAAT